MPRLLLGRALIGYSEPLTSRI